MGKGQRCVVAGNGGRSREKDGDHYAKHRRFDGRKGGLACDKRDRSRSKPHDNGTGDACPAVIGGQTRRNAREGGSA